MMKHAVIWVPIFLYELGLTCLLSVGIRTFTGVKYAIIEMENASLFLSFLYLPKWTQELYA